MEFDHGGYPPAYKGFLDFSSNVNPLPFPRSIKSTKKEFWERIRYYPDPYCEDLKALLGKKLGISEEEIFLGAGSTELIYLVLRLINPKSTLIFFPTFSEYEKASMAVNSDILSFKLSHDFSLPEPKGIEVDVLFLCHPNNPTGNFLVRSKEEIFLWKAKYYIIDEAFIDFSSDENSFIPIFRKDKRIIVLRTFTKFFPLAGMRIGFVVAERSLVSELRRRSHPWRIPGLSSYLVEKFLKDENFQKRTRDFVRKERGYLEKELRKLSFKVYPSVTNFILFGLREGETSKTVSGELKKRRILVRDCSNFKGLDGEFLRICVRLRKENRILIQALKSI